ncbi:MAG: discoidin domain-containing protein, partial [Solirubrobacterales bacterium]
MCRKSVCSLIALTALAMIAGTAQGSPYDRVAYWDSGYATSWAGDGIAVRDALQAAGYTVVNAAELKTWMDARIADKKLSVVIFCRDDVPSTVAETQTTDCTIRKYLDAGGKVVFYGDIPFYYQATTGGGTTNWGTGGSTNILGFNAAGGTWDAGAACTITETGTKWGLTTTWTSSRPAAGTGIDNFEILASDKNGNAPAWVKHYVAGDTFRGVVRIEDKSGAPVSIEQLIAVAEYAESIASAMSPIPENGATDVLRDVSLGWTAGEFAATHNVYLGTSFDDVNNATAANPLGVLVSEGQTDTTYNPPAVFQYGQTYYWRVDEANAAPDNTIFKGEVWSFTVEPVGYPITAITATASSAASGMGPENTINGSGINADDQHSTDSTQMWTSMGALPAWIQYEFDKVYELSELWVWNSNQLVEGFLGFGAKDVVVEYSLDGATWTQVQNVPQFAKATGAPTYTANTTVDLTGVVAKYVRLTISSNWGGITPQTGLSEVRFFYVPVQAREPNPADDATGVAVDTTLTWRAGRQAASHTVYFGADEQAVVDGTATAQTVSDNNVTPDDLLYGNVYYWKVVETNATETVTEWAGDVWTFTTEEYGTIDDFEIYNDEDSRIYDAWVDGLTDGASGSQVGYNESPFAEKTIIHGGKQSMPLIYDNASFAASEATRTFATGQDWTARGIKGLAIYFRGAAENSGNLYVKIGSKKIAYDGPAMNIARPSWQLWSIDLSTAGNVSNVKSLVIGVEGSGAKGTLYIDDIRLYPEVLDDSNPDVTGAGDTVQGVPNDADWPTAEYPDLAIDDNVNTKFLHRKGGAMATGIRVAPLTGSSIVTGLTFTSANDAATRDPIKYKLSGSNTSIDGPYTQIAAG